LASLESIEIQIEYKPYRLHRQVRSLILCEPQWAGKGIDMDVSLEEITITADEDLISQVWNNLIHNSIKFTPEGGKVSVDLRQHDGSIEFKITDTGIGISESDRARVFERFYKADKSRRRSAEGSGLGLAIVK
jgi:two-component system, OmpR family, phosphate regulon sensor histidine kinase PhoR